MESLLYFWTANVIDTHLQSTRNISTEISSFADYKQKNQEGASQSQIHW